MEIEEIQAVASIVVCHISACSFDEYSGPMLGPYDGSFEIIDGDMKPISKDQVDNIRESR